MDFRSLLSFAANILDKLTKPIPALTTETERSEAYLLSVMSLVFIALSIALLPTSFAWGKHGLETALTVAALIASITTYRLSRGRNYRLGGYLMVVFITLSTVIIATVEHTMQRTIFLILPIFLAGLFAPVRIIFLVILVAMTTAVISHPNIFERLLMLVFIGCNAALIITTTAIRRRAERELIRNTEHKIAAEARFRATVESSLDSFYILESVRDANNQIIDFRIIDTNARGALLVALPREQMIGQLMCEILPHMRKRGFFDQYVQVVETGVPLDEEVLFPTLTSPGRWLHHVALKVGDGVAITTRDVTPRKRSELALRESESRNRALIEAIPDLMFVIGRDGKYLDFHAPNSSLLLVSSEQFMGRNIEDVLPPYLVKRLRDRIDQAIITDTPQTIEYRLNLPSGMTEFEARIVAHDIDKVLMIVRDITERKQAEQLAFEMEVERERTSMIAKFIQTASHEFRTPLAIISTSVYLMERNTDPAQRKVRAERIQEQVTNISNLVEALVLMAKLDSSKDKDLELADTPIKPLIEQIAAEYEPRARKQSHQFQMQLSLCNPSLEVDPHLLQIAIQNLLDNALRFTHPGGRVYLGLTCEQRQIQISVSDNGAGIPPDSQPYIFERFYRLDEARSTQGFGLGLAIAKKIIELHNGTISFHSALGEGSSFTITLPIPGEVVLDRDQE